jgi:TRAP-type C4-dicarboxylate transport system permease small subunit
MSATANLPAPVAQRPGLACLVERLLAQAEAVSLAAASLCLVVMLAINTVNLVVRNLSGSGLVWVWAWTSVLFVWCVFLAFFVLYRRSLDVSVDLLVARVPAWARTAIGVLVCLSGLLFCGVIVLQAPQILQRQLGALEFVGLQRYCLSIPLVWSSAWLVVHFLMQLRHPAAQFQTTDKEAPTWSL